MSDKIYILGVQVAATNLRLASLIIGEWVKNKTKTYICVAPVSTIVDCQKDLNYKNIINLEGNDRWWSCMNGRGRDDASDEQCSQSSTQ